MDGNDATDESRIVNPSKRRMEYTIESGNGKISLAFSSEDGDFSDFLHDGLSFMAFMGCDAARKAHIELYGDVKEPTEPIT